ncbi:long-chain fatty acid transport protein [Pimephales promelas]|nr:long-chain fatty acid transport protein [Pimephales promelas]
MFTVLSKRTRTKIFANDQTYSYVQSDKQSNKIARSLLKHADLHEGDTVALLLGNEPMFLWICLALTKIGCSAALLNHNIRSKSLLHCFTCCEATVLIAGPELQDAVEEVLPALREQGVSVYILTDHVTSEGMKSLTDKIKQASDEPVPADLRANARFNSPAAYIYTSGTTGLPKAAVITHLRLWVIAFFQSICGVTSDDVVYVCLPLYHSAGFGFGFGGAIERGSTIVLKSKFSSSQFWDDCRKYNVTVILYIGETMRYLCNTPKILIRLLPVDLIYCIEVLLQKVPGMDTTSGDILSVFTWTLYCPMRPRERVLLREVKERKYWWVI